MCHLCHFSLETGLSIFTKFNYINVRHVQRKIKFLKNYISSHIWKMRFEHPSGLTSHTVLGGLKGSHHYFKHIWVTGEDRLGWIPLPITFHLNSSCILSYHGKMSNPNPLVIMDENSWKINSNSLACHSWSVTICSSHLHLFIYFSHRRFLMYFALSCLSVFTDPLLSPYKALLCLCKTFFFSHNELFP